MSNDLDNDNNTPQALSDEEKFLIRKLAETYDKDKKGGLDFDEFLGFMKAATGLKKIENIEGEVPENGRVCLYQLKYLYDGMDINGSNNLSIDEICQCFAALRGNDFKWLAKFLFRGCDVDRSRKIKIDEIKSSVQKIGKEPFSPEEFQEKCQIEFGSNKKELEYWEFYKILSGETLPKDTDPYDGMIVRSSKCCLLL
ncbi:EF-hand family protein [Tritrichomonas foetus]|uniref:EF-hand family protein n=1 Tax=Tritrichomonas foetus TaxID=1144522 RepID=A0A1J4KJ30_9EUKA|nr:EF-hand family protein [Tritrichomonas foetus]|eukprot:OHT11351.1 EF-hand family protein [Tritrichomonas foetus]